MGDTKAEQGFVESRRRGLWSLALFLGVAAYVVLAAGVGRPLGMDEVFFKAPGLNWARTGQFAAPELTGFLQQGREPVQPSVDEVWFVHPPLYPFLFGVWTRLVGFGPGSCIVFDAAIHGLLVLLTFALARRIGEGLPDRACFAIAVAILPIGIFCRPDELAMCFGLAALIPLLSEAVIVDGATNASIPWPWIALRGARTHTLRLPSRTPKNGLHCVARTHTHSALRIETRDIGYAAIDNCQNCTLSALLLGLSAATSVGAAILFGFVGFILLVHAHRPAKAIALAIALWCATAIATLMLAVLPILLAHPTAFHQYLAHAAEHVHSGNFLRNLLTHWENEQFHRSVLLACLAVLAASLFAPTERLSWRQWLRLWAGPLLGLAFLAIWLPDKIYYTWFLGPWMIVAAVVTWRTRVCFAHPLLKKAVVLVVVCLYAIAVMPFCKKLVSMATLPRSQTLAENVESVRKVIPRGSSVLTDDYWWVLADDYRVYDLYFARLDPDRIDYIILTGNGSGDPHIVRRLPEYLADYVPTQFHPLVNTINTQPLTIFGQEIPGTAFGFGALVLERNSVQSSKAR